MFIIKFFCISDNKILTFKVFQFGVMALAQESHINMPFQSWEIRPRGVNHVKLTVIAAIIEIEIEIKVGIQFVNFFNVHSFFKDTDGSEPDYADE